MRVIPACTLQIPDCHGGANDATVARVPWPTVVHSMIFERQRNASEFASLRATRSSRETSQATID
jgi:hypothetical protein